MSERDSLQKKAEYLLVRGVLWLMGLLPRAASIAVGRFLGRVAYFALGRLRFIGLRNLRRAFPNSRKAERRRILRSCFDGLGRQLGEFCQFERATVADLRKIVEYDPESLARYREAKQLERGIIMVTAHLGGWELLPFAGSAFGDRVSILIRPIENPRIERFVQSVRTRFGNETISKQFAGLTCLRILRKGGTIGILADLNSLPQEGVFVPFFGELACTTLAVAALALPSNAVVFPVFAPWDAVRRKYLFYGGPALEMLRTGDHERDLAVNTARVSAVIEKAIRCHPGQWLWIHDRWHALVRPGDRICNEMF
jgi:KDO2-lipid IV(A) lauroyltransferase